MKYERRISLGRIRRRNINNGELELRREQHENENFILPVRVYELGLWTVPFLNTRHGCGWKRVSKKKWLHLSSLSPPGRILDFSSPTFLQLLCWLFIDS
jgi:hypothetical protein